MINEFRTTLFLVIMSIVFLLLNIPTISAILGFCAIIHGIIKIEEYQDEKEYQRGVKNGKTSNNR